MAVQLKIVDFLDNLSIYTHDINLGLPAEIITRIKQYNYYSQQLLDFNPLTDLKNH